MYKSQVSRSCTATPARNVAAKFLHERMFRVTGISRGVDVAHVCNHEFMRCELWTACESVTCESANIGL